MERCICLKFGEDKAMLEALGRATEGLPDAAFQLMCWVASDTSQVKVAMFHDLLSPGSDEDQVLPLAAVQKAHRLMASLLASVKGGNSWELPAEQVAAITRRLANGVQACEAMLRHLGEWESPRITNGVGSIQIGDSHYVPLLVSNSKRASVPVAYLRADYQNSLHEAIAKRDGRYPL